MPPAAADVLALAQTRLWLNALSPLTTAPAAHFDGLYAANAGQAFVWQAGTSSLLEADWLKEAARQTPSTWYIHCAEKATPPATGCLLCIEKTKELGLLLMRFDYHMQFNERQVQWQWLDLLAQQHQGVVWGVIPAEQ